MRTDPDRLADILETLDRIERYTRRGRASFERQELVQTWVIHHLEILGEAARGVSQDLRERHRDVPWNEMAAMRNVLAHGYFGIDVERVWRTVERDLPPLRALIQAILSQSEGA